MKTGKTITTLLSVLLLSGAGLAAAGCTTHHEGPAERAGKKVDHAAVKAGDAAEDAGKKINHALPGD